MGAKTFWQAKKGHFFLEIGVSVGETLSYYQRYKIWQRSKVGVSRTTPLRMTARVLAHSFRALLPCVDDGQEEGRKDDRVSGVRIAPGSSAAFTFPGEPLVSGEKTQVCLQRCACGCV